jgi:hypothetical protein
MLATAKAIETRYKGCRFRSRLEARWAVFFDSIGVEWQYEPEGFEGFDGSKYLPDFYLPNTGVHGLHVSHDGSRSFPEGVYVEVKPSKEKLHEDSGKIGNQIDWRTTPVSMGLLLLGSVPSTQYGVSHDFLYWDSGVSLARVSFQHYGLLVVGLASEGATQEIPSVTTPDPHICERYANAMYEAYAAARSARFEFGESGARR